MPFNTFFIAINSGKDTIMAKVATKAAPAPAVASPSFWPTVGAAWVKPELTNGKQILTVRMNNGTRLVLRERLQPKRAGKKDPDFDICMPPVAIVPDVV